MKNTRRQTNADERKKEKKHDQTEKCRKKQPRSRSTLRFLCTTAYFSVNNVYTLQNNTFNAKYSSIFSLATTQADKYVLCVYSLCRPFSLSLAHSPSPSLYLSLSLCLSLSPTLLSCVYICILLCVHVESE